MWCFSACPQALPAPHTASPPAWFGPLAFLAKLLPKEEQAWQPSYARARTHTHLHTHIEMHHSANPSHTAAKPVAPILSGGRRREPQKPTLSKQTFLSLLISSSSVFSLKKQAGFFQSPSFPQLHWAAGEQAKPPEGGMA